MPFPAHMFPDISAQMKGSNADSTLNANRKLVLQLLIEHEALSRKELASLTGLQGATITLIINELLEKEFVIQTGYRNGGNGRRVAQFSFNHRRFYCAAAMIYSSYITIGVYTTDQALLNSNYYDVDTRVDMEQTLDILARQLDQLRRTVSDKLFIGTSVAVDGAYRYQNGEMVFESADRGSLSFRDELEKRLNCCVQVQRTLYIAAYELHRQNQLPGHGVSSFLYFFDQSVMCGLVINGETYAGVNGNSGNVGSVLLRDPHGQAVAVEDVLSVNAMLRQAERHLAEVPDSKLPRTRSLVFNDLRTGAYESDPFCVQFFDGIADYLGQLIAVIFNTLDPIKIILGDFFPLTDRFIDRTIRTADANCVGGFSREVLVLNRVPRNPLGPAYLGGVRLLRDQWIANLSLK